MAQKISAAISQNILQLAIREEPMVLSDNA
jgi:hypothetical protein